ncbi:putative coiled-coil domain-containing protein 144C [Myotis yumanensis]|uniref:putative coiled-coil domain-containing protein 144C n=1 Tax=Myotis yumanensis TaxID=159337 RepID=UPI0038D0C7EE
MNKVAEKKKQQSSKREVSGNMADGADDDHDSIGLNQQSNSEESDEMTESTVILVKKVEEKKDQKTIKREVSGNMDEGADDSGSGGLSQQSNSEQTDQQQVSIMENDESDRLCSKPGIGDSRPISHNEDLKDKVISETHTTTAKTSENQSKHIHLPPLHLEKMTQESQINRACDKEDTSAYSGHPSVQKEEEMGIKQGTLEQRKNLQLYEDESKQRSHEFSVKFKMTECPEEEPLRDNSKEGASLRQMPSNLTSKMLDCEGKDAFEMSVSAALQTFPEGEETSLKIVSPSHADPGSSKDSPSSSSSELRLREKELHSENDHKPEAEHVLNKNEESFYNDTENKKERHAVVTSEVREDQEFAMQMTKNMNRNTTDWKLGIGPTPQSRDLKSHLELQHPCFNETKLITEIKSHNMSAVTNTHKETKPSQDVFQKPLRVDNCSANYCKSMDSKLKDESSSALHNDRTPGVYVHEEFQRFKNKVDMFNAEHLVWKREKIQPQKEVEEEKKQKSIERKVSGNMYNAADDDSGGRSQKNKVEQADKQQLPVMGSEDSDRSALREQKEKRRKADLLREKNRVQLRKKEEHSIKEVEMNPQLETTIGTQAITLEIIGENEVSESSGKEKSLLHGNHMLWNEIAKLRLEIGTIKNQLQEMGKKFFEAIAIVKEKSDCLEKTIRKTVFQHNVELEVLRAELIMLNSKLEDEQQNRGRLEAEVESYRSRLATAVQDHEHCQTSKGDLQFVFQRPRDECLWDKMNFDMSNLKHNNEILSQQLSKLETKINSLEIELHHTRDALNERTLVLERDLIQKQCQKEKTEYVYQKEQVHKDIGKQESLQERLSHLQSEINTLDQAHNKVDREEKTVINIQDQIKAIIKIFNDEIENGGLIVNEIIKDVIDGWHHIKERIHQCENDDVERNAIVKQLQQELADSKTKLPTIEFFPEIESRHHMHLEDKKQDFKNKLDQSRSQNDDLKAKLQPSSSKCLRLDEEKSPQQQLAMGALLKQREELKDRVKKLKQEAVNLRTSITEDCVGEKHKVTAKDLADQVTQLDLFLQTQRASQETSE